MSGTPLLSNCALVIPALNEAETIATVVANTLGYGKPIVIDDGSTDKTSELAAKAGALVVCHEINQGYDSALETGLIYAIENGFEFVITLDGDGQHQTEVLRHFFDQLSSGADIVVGIRDKKQRFSEIIFSSFAILLWNIQDPLCGMKGYRISQLKKITKLKTYPSIGTELTIRAARSGWNICQIPVPTQDRNGETSRFGSGLRADWRILGALVVGLIRANRFPVTMSHT